MFIFKHSNNGAQGLNAPKRIIVHAMASRITWDGYNHSAEDFLDEIGLSAHAIVRPNGDIVRMRGDNEIAYHAKGHNNHTLGIEFEVPDCASYADFKARIMANDWVTAAQYSAGTEQILQWMELYDIQAISRHSDIDPGRKVDPGEGFPWEQLLTDIQEARGTLA